jgi:hypothetical protein
LKSRIFKKILDEADNLGYDKNLINISLDLYYSYAKNLYEYEKLDSETYSYYKQREKH